MRKYGEGTSEEATPRLLRGLAPLAVEGFGPRKRLVGRKPLKLFACGCLHPNASAWRLGAEQVFVRGGLCPFLAKQPWGGEPFSLLTKPLREGGFSLSAEY